MKYSNEEAQLEIPCRVWLPSTRRTILVDLMALPPEAMGFDSIAHALATNNRFNGHTPNPYSVAQHSMLVASLLPPDSSPELLLQALMHDAAEAYISDVISPIKAKIGTLFKPIEHAVEKQLFFFHGIPLPGTEVKERDLKALWLEQFFLQGRVIPPECQALLTSNEMLLGQFGTQRMQYTAVKADFNIALIEIQELYLKNTSVCVH